MDHQSESESYLLTHTHFVLLLQMLWLKYIIVQTRDATMQKYTSLSFGMRTTRPLLLLDSYDGCQTTLWCVSATDWNRAWIRKHAWTTIVVQSKYIGAFINYTCSPEELI